MTTRRSAGVTVTTRRRSSAGVPGSRRVGRPAPLPDRSATIERRRTADGLSAGSWVTPPPLGTAPSRALLGIPIVIAAGAHRNKCSALPLPPQPPPAPAPAPAPNRFAAQECGRSGRPCLPRLPAPNRRAVNNDSPSTVPPGTLAKTPPPLRRLSASRDAGRRARDGGAAYSRAARLRYGDGGENDNILCNLEYI